jgi:sugar lactone lactonase YvrE
MAAPFQIWRYDYSSGSAAVFSGDGYERNQNGRSGPGTSWAQPSGLTLSPDGSKLFVADSESSSVRSASLADGQECQPPAGRSICVCRAIASLHAL